MATEAQAIESTELFKDMPPDARGIALATWQATCAQMGFDSNQMTPDQVAKTGVVALRSLFIQDQTLDVAIYLIATELCNNRAWLALGMSSWDEYVDSILIEGDVADKWRNPLVGISLGSEVLPLAPAGVGRDPDKVKHWLKQGVPEVLVKAKTHPVVLEDGTTVNHAWIASNKPSATEELIPLASRLDLDDPEDLQTFSQALTVAATQPREELRNFKQQTGHMRSQKPRVDIPAELVEVVDTDTGEVTHYWRVPAMTFESEADWNFYWMALQRHYNFHLETRQEKAQGKNQETHEPKSNKLESAPSGNGRGSGRGKQSASMPSVRNRDRRTGKKARR